MKRWMPAVLLGLSVAALTNAAAQDDDLVRRNRGGTINAAPYPAVYRVAGVDDYNRIVWLRARNGSDSAVHVPEWVFDLCKLDGGDLVRVDFYSPDTSDPSLQAASIWPIALSGQDRCTHTVPSPSTRPG